MTSTLPASGRDDVADGTTLVRAWADTAEDADALGVAAQLLAADPDPDAVLRARRARLLLVAGRPEEALALLPEDAPERPRGWPDVVGLACRAALGDDEALGALLRFGATVPAPQSEIFADLLAAAAAGSGRTTLADDAAHDVPVRPTPLSVRRRVVARVHQRGRAPETVATTVLDCAHALLLIQPPADDDPGVAAAVLSDLRDRGDAPGAALLAEALFALRPESAGLRALRHGHRARGNRAAAGLVVSAAGTLGVLLVVTAAAAGLPVLVWAGVPAVVLLALLVHPRAVTSTSLGEWDGRAWRVVRRQLRAFPDGGSRFAFALTGAFAGATAVAVAVIFALALFAPSADLGADPAWNLPFLALVLAGATLGPPALERLRLHELARRGARSRTVGRTAQDADLTRCACWSEPAMRGRVAELYAAWHLEPGEPVPAPAARLQASTPPEVRTCPDSGLRWLLVPAPDEPGALLLRGPARLASPDGSGARAPDGGYL